jgi:parallel beta-helix repeat protein
MLKGGRSNYEWDSFIRRKKALLLVAPLLVAVASFVFGLGSKNPDPPWLTVGEPVAFPPYPSGNFTPDFDTIQDAIDNAEPGWGIVVLPTYDYTRESFPIEVDKPVKLIAKGKVVVKAPGPPQPPRYVFHVTADTVTIEGFEIKGAWHHGIFLDYVQYCKIMKNTIVENKGHGIHLENAQNCEIRYNNVSFNDGRGVSLVFSHDNLIDDNHIENNNKHSVYFLASEGNLFSDNVVIPKKNKAGVFLAGSIGNTIEYNEFQLGGVMGWGAHGNLIIGNIMNQTGVTFRYGSRGNSIVNNEIIGGVGGGGIKIYGEDPPTVMTSDGNLIEDNKIWNCPWHGIQIYRSNNNVIKGNIVNASQYHGIWLSRSNGTTLKQNQVNHNGWSGISLDHSWLNKIEDNQASFNEWVGIDIHGDSDYNIVDSNVATYNQIGIRLQHEWAPPTIVLSADHNEITNNIALFNSIKDLYKTPPCTGNEQENNYYVTIYWA